MKRLIVKCEGATEQAFCKQVLRPYLFPNPGGVVKAIEIASAKHHGRVHRGGVRKYEPFRRDLLNALRQYPGGNSLFTTMLDLYALPADYPGRDLPRTGQSRSYVERLEAALGEDIGDYRFVPNYLLHEFETLVLADLPNLAHQLADDPLIGKKILALEKSVENFSSVEEINDTPTGAPSKRILAMFPQYNKRLHGPLITEASGVDLLRERCPHFGAWIRTLQTRLA